MGLIASGDTLRSRYNCGTAHKYWEQIKPSIDANIDRAYHVAKYLRMEMRSGKLFYDFLV